MCFIFVERIVMTPVKKTPKSATIRIERVRPQQVSADAALHVAGGDHQGIIVSKPPAEGTPDSRQNIMPHLQLEFKVYLVNSSQTHTLVC